MVKVENKNVRFIRKHGRIIPIRKQTASGNHGQMSDKEQHLQGVRSGAGLYLTGSLASFGAAIPGLNMIKRNQEKIDSVGHRDLTKHISSMQRKYGKEISKAKVNILPSVVDAVAPTTKIPFLGTKMADFGDRIIRRGLLVGTPNENMFLHELGHAVAIQKKGSWNRTHWARALTSIRSGNKTKIAMHSLNDIAMLAREFEANKEAISIIKSRGGKFGDIMKYVKNVGPAQSTYLLRAGGNLAALAGLGMAAYHGFKLLKGRENKVSK